LDQQRKIEFTKLAPVLNVGDLASERRFYESLGLPVIYEGSEYPDFIAFGTDVVDLGIQQTHTDLDHPVCSRGSSALPTSTSRSPSAITKALTTSWTYRDRGPIGCIAACS
jgi:hypothetical protein